jgi:DNA-binding transcriptional LysR family regulator
MITFYQLESFCKIVEEGTFRSAAEKLFISQPSISQHVASLEKHFQIQLFIRQGRKIKLTPEGRLLYASAKEITKKIDNLGNRFRDLKNLKYGELKIGCSGFTGSYILPQTLEVFRQKYPLIKISILCGRVGELLHYLDDNQIELVIMGKDLNWACEPQLTYKPLGMDELIFVGSRRHHLAGREVDARALEKETLIAFSERNNLSSYIKDFLLRYELRPSNIIEVDDLGMGKQLALQGLGITLTSRIAVTKDLQEGRLCQITLKEKEKLSWQIDAIYHSSRGLTYAGWEMLKILENMPALSIV